MKDDDYCNHYTGNQLNSIGNIIITTKKTNSKDEKGFLDTKNKNKMSRQNPPRSECRRGFQLKGSHVLLVHNLSCFLCIRYSR